MALTLYFIASCRHSVQQIQLRLTYLPFVRLCWVAIPSKRSTNAPLPQKRCWDLEIILDIHAGGGGYSWKILCGGSESVNFCLRCPVCLYRVQRDNCTFYNSHCRQQCDSPSHRTFACRRYWWKTEIEALRFASSWSQNDPDIRKLHNNCSLFQLEVLYPCCVYT